MMLNLLTAAMSVAAVEASEASNVSCRLVTGGTVPHNFRWCGLLGNTAQCFDGKIRIVELGRCEQPFCPEGYINECTDTVPPSCTACRRHHPKVDGDVEEILAEFKPLLEKPFFETLGPLLFKLRHLLENPEVMAEVIEPLKEHHHIQRALEHPHIQPAFEQFEDWRNSHLPSPTPEPEIEHVDYEEQPMEHLFKALAALQSEEANGEFEHGCPLLTCMAAFQHANGCELGDEFTHEEYDQLVAKLPTECLECERGAMEYACPPPSIESEGVGAMSHWWKSGFVWASEWNKDGATGAMSDSLMGKPMELTWCKLFDPFCFTACCWAEK